jgi:hypothetical protein
MVDTRFSKWTLQAMGSIFINSLAPVEFPDRVFKREAVQLKDQSHYASHISAAAKTIIFWQVTLIPYLDQSSVDHLIGSLYHLVRML